MAISKLQDFYGFETDVYIKISSTLISETGEDSEGKLYKAEVLLDWFTNPTKSHHFSQTKEEFIGLRMEALTLPSLYGKLLESEKFIWYNNA